jgi:hypothetical protein
VNDCRGVLGEVVGDERSSSACLLAVVALLRLEGVMSCLDLTFVAGSLSLPLLVVLSAREWC